MFIALGLKLHSANAICRGIRYPAVAAVVTGLGFSNTAAAPSRTFGCKYKSDPHNPAELSC